MKTSMKQLLLASVVMMTMSAPAFAQDAAPAATPSLNAGEETQRDVNQQERIEQGLKDGELTTKEAAKLEKGEAKIDRVEAKDMKDGKLTTAEKARIQQLQDQESKRIYAEKHDTQKGNPDSASSKRMQEDVQRDVNQEKRINEGVKSGELTNKEVGKLERGQSKDDRAEARAGRDGHVGKNEQRNIQKDENRQSGKVYAQKHDRQKRGERNRGERGERNHGERGERRHGRH